MKFIHETKGLDRDRKADTKRLGGVKEKVQNRCDRKTVDFRVSEFLRTKDIQSFRYFKLELWKCVFQV